MRRPKQDILTLAEAAAWLGSSVGMIYGWVKRGHVKSRRDKRGRHLIRYVDLKKYIDQLIFEERERIRIKEGRLTDEEFIQRLWDNDPD